MGKHDGPPPFKFRKENGRLVPYSAWDHERIETYSEGAILTVHVTQEKSRPLERKYWAILHEVVEKCAPHFRSAENLHKAVRFGLGVVDPFVDADGNFQVELRSTTKMQEPEYRRYFDEAMTFLHQMTGVDPLTLHAESADVGEDDISEPSSPPPSDDAGSVDPDPNPTDAADPADQAEAGAGSLEAADGQSAAPAPELTDDDKAFLVRVFKTMRDCVGPSVDDFTRAALIFKEEIAGKSLAVKAKATTIRLKLEECCGDDPKLGTVQAAKYLAGVIGVDERGLA